MGLDYRCDELTAKDPITVEADMVSIPDGPRLPLRQGVQIDIEPLSIYIYGPIDRHDSWTPPIQFIY